MILFGFGGPILGPIIGNVLYWLVNALGIDPDSVISICSTWAGCPPWWPF